MEYTDFTRKFTFGKFKKIVQPLMRQNGDYYENISKLILILSVYKSGKNDGV